MAYLAHWIQAISLETPLIPTAPSTLCWLRRNAPTFWSISPAKTATPSFCTATPPDRSRSKLNFTSGNPGVPPQQPALLATFDGTQWVIPSGTPTLIKTLNEDFDDFGRLLQRGGTDQQFINNQGQPTFGQGYMDSITETVSAGAVQTWDHYNTTGDTHPWHYHLVNVQVVGRGMFALEPDGTPDFGNFTDFSGHPGKLTPPDPNELGWKETVRMNPGEITRVVMRFDLPKLPKSMGDPKSPGTGGHEYVHHCHILEHEEHDMMRTLVVT